MLYCVPGRQDELAIHEREWNIVWDWFFNHDMKSLPNEEIQLVDGLNVKVMLQEYQTSPLEERGWETHDKYFDVMYIDEGEELVGIVPRSRLGAVKIPYNEPGDITWYESADNPTWVNLQKGDILIVSPDEGHNSRVAVNEPCFVRKLVAKVHI